ncbi:MAG TPA: hypothetical protein PK016_01515 [Candidatus Atribacteria bacterium]|nr:hypothetical protein [Candidatus Atribacteria bacterium]
MPIKNIWITYSQEIFENQEENYYKTRNELKGKTLTMIEEALREGGWEVNKINVDLPLPRLTEFLSQKVDLIFNLTICVSGIYNQAFLPLLLDANNIPYLGSNSVVHSLCLDRSLSKLCLRGVGIPTPSYFLWSTKEEIPENLDFPLIVKPRFRSYQEIISEQSVVSSPEELERELQRVFSETKDEVIGEKFLTGREMIVGIWGNGKNVSPLPIMEVNISRQVPLWDFKTRNNKGYVEDVLCPAPLEEEQKSQIEKMALRIFQELHMRDYATFKLIFSEKEGIPFFFELNSLPSLYYRHSAFPEMCNASGIDYKTMIQKLARIAEERVVNKI